MILCVCVFLIFHKVGAMLYKCTLVAFSIFAPTIL